MERAQYRLAAVTYVDVVGFSRIMQQDEHVGLALLTSYNNTVRTIAHEHNGTLIKTDGDGLLLDFPNTLDAFRCACAVQKAADSIDPTPDGAPVRLRAAVHLGDIYFRENDALGNGVTIASRLTDRCSPGRIVISEEVYHQISHKLTSVSVRELGEQSVEGIDRPVTAYEVALDVAAGAEAGERQDRRSGQGTETGLKEQVLSMIRERGERPDRAGVIRRLGLDPVADAPRLDKLVERGLIRRRPVGEDDPEEDEEDDHDDYHTEVGGGPGSLKRLLRRSDLTDRELSHAYRAALERRVDNERAGLAGHTTSFLGVNTMIIGIWAWSGAGFPWFLFPLLGWGIGYVSHRTNVTARSRELSQLKRMRRPTRDHLSLHRKLWKVRRGFRAHLAGNGMTMILLATINAITFTGFPWAAIPVGFMGIGLVSHWSRSRREERRIKSELDSLGFSLAEEERGDSAAGGHEEVSAARPAGASGPRTYAEHARALRAELQDQIESLPETHAPVADDFRNVIDTYVSQIEALSRAREEVEELIAGIPISALEDDRRRLSERAENASDERLKAEYERSIEQVDQQRRSYSELKSEQEMLRVRAETGVNALKQLKIDLGRARTSRERAAQTSLEDLRAKSGELSRYLNDLRDAYEELE